MTTTTHDTSRTAYLLALMKKGDDAFNARDMAGMDAVHHPDMFAYVTENAQPLYGRAAHAAAMQQMFRIFPDVHVDNDPYPVQFGSGDWITMITMITWVTETFTGEMTMPDGTVIPRQEKRSTSSSARPSSGTATGSSRLPRSGTPLCRRGRSARPSPEQSGGNGRRPVSPTPPTRP
jgi:hypothetical protein